MSGENNYAKKLLAQRGRRAAATLLTYLEDNTRGKLTNAEWEDLRGKVLAVIGDFQDLAMDMVASETGAINEHWANAIAEIHDVLRRIDGHLAVPADR